MSSTPSSPRSRWLAASLIAQMAIGLLAMTMCLPSMQEWPAIFGASQARVQLTFSVFVAAYGSLQLLHGPLSDRLGRRPVLLAGLVLVAVGSVLAALAPNLGTLVLARALQGAGSAAGMVVGRATIQDLYVGPERTRMMAFVGMTMGVCPPVATLLGGHLHVRAGWQAGFWVVAVLAVLLAVAGWRTLPAGRPAAGGAPQPWSAMLSGYRTLARVPAFACYVLILAGATGCFYAFLGGAPLVFKNFDVTPDRLGLYIMCIPLAYIVGNVLVARLAEQRGERAMMRMGQAVSFAGLGLMLALSLGGVHTALAVALPLVLLGIGHGLLVPPTLAGSVGLIPALAGSAAAVAGLMQQVGGALGGFFVGVVEHDEATNLALQMIFWMGLSLCAQLLLGRMRVRRG